MIVENPGMCLRVASKYSEYNFACLDYGMVTIFYSNENEKREIERDGKIKNLPIETNYCFHDHYMKIRNLRSELVTINKNGIEYEVYKRDENHGLIENHPYVGKKVIFEDDRKDKKEYFVESVHKHWSWGYYLFLLYYNVLENGNKSHGGIMYENISCQDPHILENINENKVKLI